jgi:alanine racemase
MSTEPRSRAWIEVDGTALRRNLETIRRMAGPRAPVVPMVKADAYGLGMGDAVRILEPSDPWGWGVATVEEGVELRIQELDRPILVFAPTPPGAVGQALDARLTLCVSDVHLLERIVEEAKARKALATVHLEVDTGMGRAGFYWARVEEWLPAVTDVLERSGGRVRWEGTFTHFHSADQADPSSVETQAGRFAQTVARMPDQGGAMTHLCNSAAVLRKPELARQGARPGIFLYGGSAGQGLVDPAEVVAVRARIALIREVPPGTTVGYGATYRSRRRERWATLGIGYGDGLRRALSNRAHVLAGNRRVPIVGRISMDMTVVDITDLPQLIPGDVVTVLGTQGTERITLEEMASLADTNNYEILTGFTRRLPRIWDEDPGNRHGGQRDAPGWRTRNVG